MPQHDFISRHMTGDPGGAPWGCVYLVICGGTVGSRRGVCLIRVSTESPAMAAAIGNCALAILSDAQVLWSLLGMGQCVGFE